MNAFILLTACVAASSAQYIAHPRVHGVVGGYPGAYAAGAYPGAYAAGAYPAAYAAGALPAGYAAAGAYPYAAAAPLNPSSQFQAQDEFGNVQYGYANLNSQKHEVGNTYGGVQGSYSYVDANGIVQTTNYVADHLGFRVQATNLPVAPAAPEVELPVAPVHVYELPVAPVYEGVAPVHVYELPVAPVYEGVAPESVQDTPEVAAAKAEHLALVAAASTDRRRRSTPADTQVLEAPLLATAPVVAPVAPLAGYPAGLPYAGYAGYAGLPAAGYGYAGLPAAGYGYAGLPHAGYGYAGHGYAGLPYAGLPAPVAPAAVVASAPATAEATLHTVKLNPGHAVAYRVY